jgi:hypothetical protein
VRQAEFLASQIHGHVSDIEYLLIARAFGSAGDHASALVCSERSGEAARDTQRAMRLRAYAGYCFEQGDLGGCGVSQPSKWANHCKRVLLVQDA